MPLLFAVGQHRALEVASGQLRAGERLFAFHDDIFMVTMPERVGAVYSVVEEQLRVQARIGIHGDKTLVWNRAGERPQICDVLERIAQMENPRAFFWRLSDIPTEQQGIKVLGTPLGHDDFVAQHSRTITRDHHLERIPHMQDVQSAWLLLLHCASARANYQILSVNPTAVEDFARTHDENVCQCLGRILNIDPARCSEEIRDSATLPLILGGLGLRSASRLRVPAFWASWADCLPIGETSSSGNPVDQPIGGAPAHSKSGSWQ